MPLGRCLAQQMASAAAVAAGSPLGVGPIPADEGQYACS